MVNRTFSILCGNVLALGLQLAITGCSAGSIPNNGSLPAKTVTATPTAFATPEKRKNPPVNGTTLTPDMSDEAILKAFGIEISKAEAKRSQGPDGYTIDYHIGDQKVLITRSVVTGVFVIASGPIKGYWELGGGNP